MEQKLAELEELTREHTAEIAAVGLMARAIVMAFPREDRVTIREALRLMIADQQGQLADIGYEEAIGPDQMRDVRARILRAATTFLRFLET